MNVMKRWLFLDLYAATMGSCPLTDKVFADIRKRVDRETRTMRQLMMLKGSLDLALAGSSRKTTEKPHLTCEERALKNKLLEGVPTDLDPDSIVYKMLVK